MHKIKHHFKSLLGIFLLPAAAGTALALYYNLKLLSLGSLSSAQWLFLGGVFFYFAVHLFFFKPVYLYVFGHELVHAVAAWLCAGKIKGFKVSKTGGSVKTTKSNFFISLAPYFIPSYVIIFSVIYFAVSLIFNLEFLVPGFIFIMGAAIAFHLVMTADVLKKKQPDIFETGYVFSFVLIFTANVIVLVLMLSLLFEQVSMGAFFRDAFFSSRDIYNRIFSQLFGRV